MRPPNRLVLKLNADWTPMQMSPWQEIMHLILEESADVLEVHTYDGEPIPIRSAPGDDGEPRFRIDMPSVIVLRQYVTVRREIRFSRHNVFQRDLYKCQYCGSDDDPVTIDHVLPRSRGGRSSFLNCVAACERCQHIKGNKTIDQMRNKKTWNGHPFVLIHVPTEIKKPGVARFVHRVTKSNICWLKYLPGWREIAPKIGKEKLIEEFEEYEKGALID